MHRVISLTLLLLGLGWWLCHLHVPGADLATVAPEAGWVRTIDGWERASVLLPRNDWSPQLHPLVVAAAQLLASLYALVAWGRD